MNVPTLGRPTAGFTLIELMIAVAVIGLLLAVAYPYYLEQTRKSRRADAFNALAAVQQAQERWRANRPAYADNARLTAAVNDPDPSLAGLGLSATSGAGYYDIAISSASATDYVITATARTGTSQAADGACATLAVRMQGGTLSYGSGSPTMNWNDTARCWPR